MIVTVLKLSILKFRKELAFCFGYCDRIAKVGCEWRRRVQRVKRLNEDSIDATKNIEGKKRTVRRDCFIEG